MILDTNAISAWWEGDRGLESILQPATKIYLPVVAIGEFRFGLLFSKFMKQGLEWLEALKAELSLIGIDDVSAQHYSDIRAELKRKGKPIPENDLWIAAVTRQYQLPLISKDRHFKDISNLDVRSW